MHNFNILQKANGQLDYWLSYFNKITFSEIKLNISIEFLGFSLNKES